MRAGTVRWTTYGVGLAAIAAATVTGCASGSSSTAASGTASPAASGSASGGGTADAGSAVQLAARSTAGATSITGTMSVQAKTKSGTSASPAASGSAASGSVGTGDLSMTATFAAKLRPSLTESVTYQSISSGGTALPGGLSGIVTPTELYLKWSYLTQALKLSKPWLAIPVSGLSKSSGLNLTQMFGSTAGGSPLSGTQLLGGASGVRKIGTGTVGGVPVTGYTGTIDLGKSLSALSGSTKTQLQQAIAKEGFKTGTFTVWIDGSHQIRKEVALVSGTALTETTTVNITSMNQPVNISLPSASQTTTAPASSLSGGTS